MIIIDAIALVKAIHKTKIIKTCNEVFLDQLSNMAGDYDEVRSVSTPLSKNKINEKKPDKGDINIISWQGHYLYPEYFFSEGDKSTTNNISSISKTIDHSKAPTTKVSKPIL